MNSQQDIKTLRDLKEGDQFRLAYEPETRIRTLCQKGRIEAYCPYDGQNTMGHSKGGGEEVFILDTIVFPIQPESKPLEGYTKNELTISHAESVYAEGGFWESEGNNIDIRVSDHDGKKAKETIQRIVKAVNGWDEAIELVTALKNNLESLYKVSELGETGMDLLKRTEKLIANH
jgi:hypothetical protein